MGNYILPYLGKEIKDMLDQLANESFVKKNDPDIIYNIKVSSDAMSPNNGDYAINVREVNTKLQKYLDITSTKDTSLAGGLVLPEDKTVSQTREGLLKPTTVLFKADVKNWALLEDASTISAGSLIEPGSITENLIADSAITTNKIATGAVTTIKILDGNITTSKIANNAINSNKLNKDAVTTEKIADNAINTNKITDSAITTDKIADESINLNKIDTNNFSLPQANVAGLVESLNNKQNTLVFDDTYNSETNKVATVNSIKNIINPIIENITDETGSQTIFKNESGNLAQKAIAIKYNQITDLEAKTATDIRLGLVKVYQNTKSNPTSVNITYNPLPTGNRGQFYGVESDTDNKLFVYVPEASTEKAGLLSTSDKAFLDKLKTVISIYD